MAILMIPGLGCTAALFSSQVEALSSRHDVTIADHQRHSSMSAIAEAILEGAPPHFGLVGLSMGGMLAFEIMRLAPDRVTRVALLNTSARSELPERKAMRAEIIATAKDHGMSAVLDQTFPFWVDASRHDDRSLRDIAGQMLEDTGAEVFERQCRALIDRPDYRGDLPNMHHEAFVIVGAGDVTTPPKLAQEIAGLMPNARLEELPACGHISTLERPDAVSDLLIEFFQDT